MENIEKAGRAQGIDHAAAFKMGVNILEKWSCTTAQKQTILRIPKSSFHCYIKDTGTVSLTEEQLERLSYLANIHQSLRIVFNSLDNVYGFMAMPNHNSFFNGRTPLSIISTGDLGVLYEVFKQIDSMKCGQR